MSRMDKLSRKQLEKIARALSDIIFTYADDFSQAGIVEEFCRIGRKQLEVVVDMLTDTALALLDAQATELFLRQYNIKDEELLAIGFDVEV